jgi:hypothetical protein
LKELELWKEIATGGKAWDSSETQNELKVSSVTLQGFRDRKK